MTSATPSQSPRVPPGGASGAELGCLFCRRRDVLFTSSEHIVPQSLGNTELVLPPGIVCDRCNNGVCSRLDAALLAVPPLATLRTALGVPNKRGAVPEYRFHNGTIGFDTKAGSYTAEMSHPRWRRPPANPLHDDADTDWLHVKTTWSHETNLRLCHRALVKIGLEWVALTHGPAAALDRSLDHERDLVAKGGDYSGYILAPARVMLDTDDSDFVLCDVQHGPDRSHLVVVVSLLGLVFATDTRHATPPKSLREQGLADNMQLLAF